MLDEEDVVLDADNMLDVEVLGADEDVLGADKVLYVEDNVLGEGEGEDVLDVAGVDEDVLSAKDEKVHVETELVSIIPGVDMDARQNPSRFVTTTTEVTVCIERGGVGRVVVVIIVGGP